MVNYGLALPSLFLSLDAVRERNREREREKVETGLSEWMNGVDFPIKRKKGSTPITD